MDPDEKRQLQKFLERHGPTGYARRHPYTKPPVTLSELELGCHEFESMEPRDSMYRVSRFLIEQWWCDSKKLVDALSVLLLTWNAAFYRYGAFDGAALETCLSSNWSVIERFSKRQIGSFNEVDENVEVSRVFSEFSKALGRTVDEIESSVGTVKALHLLAPNSFPLWDGYIADAYNCPFNGEIGSVAYLLFFGRIREVAMSLERDLSNLDVATREWLSVKPLLKRIDEYNYVRFTLPEIRRKQEERRRKAIIKGKARKG